MPVIETILGIVGSQIESDIASSIYETAKKVLEKDPFDSAIERTLDELRKERSEDFFVLDDIYLNREKIFDKIEIVNETTFQKILDKCEITNDTSSRLFKRISQKFDEIIRETAQDKQEFFFPYAIKEFRNIGKTNEEIVKILKTITQKDNIILDYFEKLEKKDSEVYYLSKIEFELKKGDELEGQFFRKEGPIWIDFEKNYVVKRDEVNKIINSFENGINHLLLIGNASSGKSVIVRNVGYELADRYGVFYISTKKFETHKVDAIFKDIMKLKENSLIIIEDVHLYPDYCDALMKDLLSKNTRIKILFTTRPTYKYDRELNYLDKCEKLTLEASDPTDVIIKKYVEKNEMPQPSTEEIETLKTKSKESLWVLAYFLMAWEVGKPIAIDQVYEKVYNDLIGLDNKYGANGSQQVILSLAPFFKYEIRVEKPFLTEELKIDTNTIKKLIDGGEIRKSNGYLSLYHSALADIYLKTSENHADLIDSLQYKLRHFGVNIQGGDYSENMFLWYINCKPKNYDEVFSQLRFEKDIVQNIFQNQNTRLIIRDLLINEHDIQKAVKFICDISYVSKELGELFVDILKPKIEKEEDIKKILLWIRDISFASKNVSQLVVDSLDPNSLKEKIEKETDITKIVKYIYDISSVNRSFENPLMDALRSKIERETDIIKIGTYLHYITKFNREMGEALAKSLLNDLKDKIEKEYDINKIVEFIRKITKTFHLEARRPLILILKTKFEKESDIEKIGEFIREISSFSEKTAFKLADYIDFDIMREKIEKESDIDKIGKCLNGFLFGSRTKGEKLANSINMGMLEEKIQKEADIIKIGKCIFFIPDKLSHDIFKSSFMNNLKEKIEKESNIRKIGQCLYNVQYVNSHAGLELIKSLDLNKLRTKIDNEKDIERIGMLIFGIFYNSKDAGKGLIDIEIFRSKVENESDIKKIYNCIYFIIKSSIGSEKEFIDIVRSKIESESDIEKMGKSLLDLSKVRKEVMVELNRSLDLKTLKLKIETETDIEKIGKFLNYFSDMCNCLASWDIMKGLAESLNMDILRSKIENEADIEKIGLFFHYSRSFFHGIEYFHFEVTIKLVSSLDLNNLKEKIENEPDIEKIGSFFGKDSFREFESKLTGLLDLNKLKDKLDAQPDISKIGSFFGNGFVYHGEFKKKLAGLLDLNNLKEKIETEPDIEKAAKCIYSISSSFIPEIKSEFFDIIKSKIEIETDIEKIDRIVDNILRLDREKMLNLLT